MTPQQRLDYVLLPDLRRRLEEIHGLLREADSRGDALNVDGRALFYAGCLLGVLDLEAEKRGDTPAL